MEAIKERDEIKNLNFVNRIQKHQSESYRLLL
jgi:hypothetical protein